MGSKKMGLYYQQQPQQGFYYNQQPQKQGFYYNQQPKQGFYYNQPEGFYYNQQEGFYYDQQDKAFYYDQRDPAKKVAKKAAPKVNNSAAWKGDEYASKLMDAVIDRTSKVLTGHFVANKHQPGEIENRVVAQISAERMCYEAAEIWMNENQPNPNISAEDIHKQLFDFVKAAIQKKDAPAKK